MEGGERVSKGAVALLAEVAVELSFIGAGGSVLLKARSPLLELGGVGIDSLDLLREAFEFTSRGRL